MPRDRTRRAVVSALPALVLAGCSGSGDDEPTDEPATTTAAHGDGTTTRPPTTTEPPPSTPEPTGYALAEPPAFDDPDVVDAGVESFGGITYASAPETELRLDLHRPAAEGPHPLLVHVHGGGWKYGDRRWTDEGRRHAGMGIAAATVDYRLSGTAHYPAAVRDVVAALTWLRRAAGEGAGIDPERVVLIGESAGAHLSALVGVAPSVESFRPPGVEPLAGGVDGVIGISGIYHLNPEEVGDSGLVRDFLGCGGDECPGDYREATPATHLDAEDPPTLLYHGTDDRIVPYEAATRYREDLRAAGVPVELITGDGGRHVTPYEDPWGDRMRNAQEEFLREHLALGDA